MSQIKTVRAMVMILIGNLLNQFEQRLADFNRVETVALIKSAIKEMLRITSFDTSSIRGSYWNSINFG